MEAFFLQNVCAKVFKKVQFEAIIFGAGCKRSKSFDNLMTQNADWDKKPSMVSFKIL